MKNETLYRGDLMIGNDSTLLKKEKKINKKEIFFNKIKNINCKVSICGPNV